ncbi:SdpI family protein [Thermoanaerobacterium thermosaccharolyticum]|uniref:SdpI family protein n=1 Tax=Thermoanaerobacterium thermosaccharolyticum TaxID=1517 RepID=UPI0005ED84EE|nr:SdpI family protein [Thermoanaerobacterium thermosaccharolyticum]KAA5806618.1 SdpI family protein [Thermoanaerobacterium thermosaccharolyticum]
MFKGYKKILLWACFFIPFIVIFFLYQDIQDSIFGINKILFIVYYFIVNLITLLFTNYRAKKISSEQNQKLLDKIDWLFVIVISIFPCILILYSTNINLSLNFPKVVSVICGLIFLGFSFTFTKLERNEVIGIKTKWTLKSDEVWNKTHRVGAVSWMIGGILFIANIFAKSQTMYLIAIIIGLILVIFVPILYSYYLAKKL